jgi:hypothetical protein
VPAFVATVTANETAAIIHDVVDLDPTGSHDHRLGSSIGATLGVNIGSLAGEPHAFVVTNNHVVVLLDDDAVVGLLDNGTLATRLGVLCAVFLDVF